MVDFGVIDEVREVLKKTTPSSYKFKPAFRAIGVNEIKQFINSEIDFAELEETIHTRTRQYAKKQRTWFKNKLIGWKNIEILPESNMKFLAQTIKNKYQY